ncbi:12481_t:CDS:1, partial [Dentiscutata erythropus]
LIQITQIMEYQQAKNVDSQQVVKSNEKNGIITTIIPHNTHTIPYNTPFTTHKQKPFTNNINNVHHSNLIHNNKKSF